MSLKPSRPWWSWPGAALVLAVVLAPMTAVLVFALCQSWPAGAMPQGFTLDFLMSVIRDERLRLAWWHTLAFGGLATALALLVGTLATLGAELSSRRSASWMGLLMQAPYAVPPVVMGLAALQWLAKPWAMAVPVEAVYLGLLTALQLPLVHRSLSALLAQLQARDLLEAAATLGVPPVRALRQVVLPLLAPGLARAAGLCLLAATTEFAIANLLLGGRVELLQPLANSLRGASGHEAAALMVFSFGTVGLLACLSGKGVSWWHKR